MEGDKKRTFSPTGEPLINLCILNEKSSRNWPLKEMLLIILESGHFSTNDPQHGSPLTIAQKNECFDSINLMNEGETEFDYQAVDSKGLSLVGHLFKKLQWFTGDITEHPDL